MCKKINKKQVALREDSSHSPNIHVANWNNVAIQINQPTGLSHSNVGNVDTANTNTNTVDDSK